MIYQEGERRKKERGLLMLLDPESVINIRDPNLGSPDPKIATTKKRKGKKFVVHLFWQPQISQN
jgi:hypothetical protein